MYVIFLRNALEGGDTIVTTGLVLQELFQGFAAPHARKDIIDAILAQLCIRHGLTLLTTNKDFLLAAKHCSLWVWKETKSLWIQK